MTSEGPLRVVDLIPRAWRTSQEDFVAWLGGHALIGPGDQVLKGESEEEDEGTNIATRVGSIGLVAELPMFMAQDISFHEVLIVKKSTSRLFGRTIVVGRSSSADITIDHASVSRKHVKFRIRRNGVVSISDDGSANGTRVNGAYVSPGEEMNLHHKDEIVIGSRSYRFYEAPRLHAMLSKMTLPIVQEPPEDGDDDEEDQ